MKILITTVFFPPQNAIASQRPYSWALTWSQAGHDVTVLTIEKDLKRSDLAPMPEGIFKTIEVPTGGFIGGLRQRRNAERTVSELSSPLGARPPEGVRSRLRKWLRRRGFLSSVRWPDVFDFWVPRARKAIPNEKFDLIVSTFGPPASLSVGYQAKKMNPEAKWICDFRDLWTDNHVYPGFWPLTILESWAEQRYLDAADGVTTVSDALAVSLQARVGSQKKVAVFENGFQPGELLTLDAASVFTDGAKRRLVYTGSLHPEHRNPRPLFEVIAGLSKEQRSQLDFIFAGPREDFLDHMISEFSLSDCVRPVGSLNRNESLRYQRDADVLLFFEKQHEASRDGVLTGKLFEYLATGRPICAIGIDSTTTVGSLLEKNGCGVALGVDADKIRRALENLLLSDRPAGRSVGASSDNRSDVMHRYDRGEISKRMLKWICEI